MAKKTCGNCRHFAKEPDAGGRGCCFLSDDLGSYPVKGEHYAPCREWKPETNWQRFYGTPEKAAKTIKHGSNCEIECCNCFTKDYMDLCPRTSIENLREWLESEEE